MSRTSEARDDFKCGNCTKVLAKNGGIQCPRCKTINGFPTEHGGRQHADVSMASNVNIVHMPGALLIRLPECNFNHSKEGELNKEVVIVRALLKENGIRFQEVAPGRIITFHIKTWRYNVTSWIDATSHGFRIVEKVTGREILEFRIEDGAIVFSSKVPTRRALVVGNSIIADFAN